MATSVTFNGSTYSIPANREPRGWGTSLSAFLVDVANSSLSKAGGNFTLTADANFGSNYGLVVKYIKSVSSNIAASGVVRLANTDKIAFRNNANGADLELGVSTSDRLQFGGVNIPTISSTDTLTGKTVVVANNTITTAASGNLAATELNAALAELQTDIDTRATITAMGDKITGPGSATDNRVVRFDGTTGKMAQNSAVGIDDSGNMTGVGSLDYVGTITGSALTASRALATDGSKGIVSSSVTSTELGYLSGVTSAIQTQLNSKFGAQTPAVLLFTTWNPSDVAGTLTNATARTTVTGTTPVSIGTISSGTVTITFNTTASYIITVSVAHTHAASYTDAWLILDYGGTATRYHANSRTAVAGTQRDWSGGESFTVTATATQTLTVQARGLVTGSGTTANHSFYATVSVIQV